MSDDDKRANNKKAAAIESEALDSRSMINFDGKDISIKMNSFDEERNADEKQRKAAIHDALTDINSELGIKEQK
jgi:hypothetical protein